MSLGRIRIRGTVTKNLGVGLFQFRFFTLSLENTKQIPKKWIRLKSAIVLKTKERNS